MTNCVLRALLAGTAITFALEAPSAAQDKFDRLDTNRDGVISREEFEKARPPRIERPPVIETDTTTPQEGRTTPTTSSSTGEWVQNSQDVIPTGSRIPRADNSFWAPVTVVTSEEVKLQGTSRTEDLINSLPQAFGAQGAAINVGSDGNIVTAPGTATVDLRGLGESRTLVLVNGRRLHPGDVYSPFADLNFIPHQLIKRVDVLTGGASSVYGAGAVSGVVNFVLDTNFVGFRVDGQISGFMHDNDADDNILNAAAAGGFGAQDPSEWDPPSGREFDGRTIDVAGTFGTTFADDRAHAQVYATYRRQQGVRTGDRDYSFCSLTARASRGTLDPGDPAGTERDFDCGVSAVSGTGTFLVPFGPGTADDEIFEVQGNQFVPGSTGFNFGPYGYLQRPDERYSLGGFADYEISPALKPYVEAMFMDDSTKSRADPSGNFFNTDTINCDNPLLSTQQFNTVCVPSNTFVDSQGVTRALVEIGRRNVEGGARQSDVDHTAFRVAGGLRGDPIRGISYDGYYQFGRSRRNAMYLNDVSVTRLRRALDAVANPAVGGVPGVPVGAPVCRIQLTDPTDLDGQNCIPYNPFQSGGVTAEQLDYLQTSAFQQGTIQESIAHVDITVRGEEYGFRSPWAERGIGLNFGAEYRKQKADLEVDDQFALGDLAAVDSDIQGYNGDFDVRDLFVEATIPLIEGRFVDLLQLNAGYRFSRFDVDGNSFGADSYHLAAELQPIRDIRARVAYNRAVRAPNVLELFYPGSIGLSGAVDPCAGAVPTATLAQCAFTGVAPAQYGTINPSPTGGYNVLFGGNTELEAEKANSWTAGLVIQPRMVPGLALTADYFDIEVKDTINGGLTFNAIMTDCLTTGNPTTCALINRNASGSLFSTDAGFIDVRNLNVGGLRTKGIDFGAAYSRPLAGGKINFSMVGTWLKDQEVKTGLDSDGANQDGSYDCAEYYGNVCGRPNPEWRHKLRLGYALANGIGISGQWRYFSSVKNDGLLNDCDVNPGPTCALAVAPANRTINAQSYFDLALTGRFMRMFDVTVGARNIFDRQPPIVGSEVTNSPFGNGNTYPQVYDALGRYLFARVSATFGGPEAPPPPAPVVAPIAPLPPPPPATQTCPDGTVVLATGTCPLPPPPPPPPAEPERG
jgi:iron complex outermembrane recepter protein